MTWTSASEAGALCCSGTMCQANTNRNLEAATSKDAELFLVAVNQRQGFESQRLVYKTAQTSKEEGSLLETNDKCHPLTTINVLHSITD
jgi:hypothetical protein